MSLPSNFVAALPAVQTAANATADHRHIVALYFNGGMDNLSTMFPTDDASYSGYTSMRGSLAQDRSTANALTGQNASLHRLLPKLAAKFNAGKLAVIGNVGTLAAPISQAQFAANPYSNTPNSLFSHADQEREHKTALVNSGYSDFGWGGRAMDLIDTAYNAAPAVPATIGVNNNSILLNGYSVIQYQTGYRGAAQVNQTQNDGFIAGFAGATSGKYLLESEFARKVARGSAFGAALNAGIAAGGDIAAFGDTSGDGMSLRGLLMMAAKIIRARVALGHRRSFIQVQWGGWDTHTDMLATLNAMLPEVDNAIDAFHEATKTLGDSGASLENDIALFTQTDFGRCGVANSTGTDHGWGGNNWVIGGAVIGGAIYRKEDGSSTTVTKNSHHNIALNGKNDAGQGRLVPTTSDDEYLATLLKWFGLPQGAPMLCALPNLGAFPISDMGFMKP